MKYTRPILFCLLATGLFYACKPNATPRAKEADEWVNKFYTRYTIRGGWGFFGSEAKDKNVNIEINVPERQAQELLGFAPYDRTAFIARNACPPKDEQIWSMLDEDGDLIIHARLNGNVFAEVPCKDKVKGL